MERNEKEEPEEREAKGDPRVGPSTGESAEEQAARIIGKVEQAFEVANTSFELGQRHKIKLLFAKVDALLTISQHATQAFGGLSAGFHDFNEYGVFKKDLESYIEPKNTEKWEKEPRFKKGMGIGAVRSIDKKFEKDLKKQEHFAHNLKLFLDKQLHDCELVRGWIGKCFQVILQLKDDIAKLRAHFEEMTHNKVVAQFGQAVKAVKSKLPLFKVKEPDRDSELKNKAKRKLAKLQEIEDLVDHTKGALDDQVVKLAEFVAVLEHMSRLQGELGN